MPDSDETVCIVSCPRAMRATVFGFVARPWSGVPPPGLNGVPT